MAKYDVCKGGGVQENQTNADKGRGGGQKTRKFCRHHLSMAPISLSPHLGSPSRSEMNGGERMRWLSKWMAGRKIPGILAKCRREDRGGEKNHPRFCITFTMNGTEFNKCISVRDHSERTSALRGVGQKQT